MVRDWVAMRTKRSPSLENIVAVQPGLEISEVPADKRILQS